MRVPFLLYKYGKKKTTSMKSEIKVAAVQMNIKSMDPESNLSHVRDFIQKTEAVEKADLVLLPSIISFVLPAVAPCQFI